jgi:hypothetical protein
MKPERYLKVYGGKKDDVFLQLLIQNTHKKWIKKNMPQSNIKDHIFSTQNKTTFL